MSAPPDAMTQILQGLLGGQQQAPQGGLMGALNQALAPYGGSNQVALSLLGNKSGGSSFGSVLGQSLQNSQQTAMENQSKKLQLAQQALQLPQLLARAQDWQQQMGGGPGPGTTLTGASALTGGQPQGPQGQQPGQQAQAPAVPVPQERQPAPPQSDFSVPQMDLGSLQVGGRSPAAAALSERLNGKDVTAAMAAETIRKAQLQSAQSAVGPRLNTLDSIIQSQSPTSVVHSNPAFLSLWRELAPSIGASPTDPHSFTDGNVRQAFGLRRNDIAAWAQLPRADVPVQDIQTTGPLNSKYATDPKTGKITQEVAPQETANFIGKDGKTVMLTKAEGMAQGLQPFSPSILGANGLTNDAVQLAADTYRTTGKMPAAFGRNPAAQARVLDRVAQDAKASGDTAGAIAARSASLKANGMALDSMTKLESATNSYAATLDKNLTNLQQSYAKVDSSGSPLVNRAVRIWQQGGTGDAQTADMVVWLNAVQGEYAKLKSGSLGNAAPSVSAMDDAKDVINKYMNAGGINAVAAAMRGEAQNRKQALAEQKAALTGASGANAPIGPVAPGQSQTINGFTVTRVK